MSAGRVIARRQHRKRRNMSKWLRLPRPVIVVDDRNGLPLAENVFEDAGGVRRPKLDANGVPIVQVLPPWDALFFLDRYLFNSRHMPTGVKGGKLVRRVRKALREGICGHAHPGWAQVDEADAEEIRKALERADRAAQRAHEDPNAPPAWEAGSIAQLIEMFECWDEANLLDSLPDQSTPAVG